MSLDPTREVRPISSRFAFKRAPMTFAAPIRRGQGFENNRPVLVRLLRGSHRGSMALIRRQMGDVGSYVSDTDENDRFCCS